jgi:hypothetical protein
VPEVIGHVYAELDSLRTLGSFIATCRYIYQCFENQRGALITRILQKELGPVLTDAKFLCLFPYMEPRDMELWDRIHAAAGLYRDMLNGVRQGEGEGDGDDSNNNNNNNMPSFKELTQICRTFYEMRYLVNTYITAQQLSWGGGGIVAAPPSRVEWLRVLRAFYRRQILCNAWAPTRRDESWLEKDMVAISNTSDHQGRSLGLCAAFPEPWELQQVDHIDHFVLRLCMALHLETTKQDGANVTSGLPMADRVPVIDQAKFGCLYSHVDHLVRYMREHPTIANAALLALPSLPKLFSNEIPGAAPAYSGFAQRCNLPFLRFGWQSHRSEILPDPARDGSEQGQQQEGSRPTVSFVRDAVETPPFGWVDALDGRYLNWFGEALHSSPGTLMPTDGEAFDARYIPLELWRAAGFTLWDRWRVEALKEQDQTRLLRTGWIVY